MCAFASNCLVRRKNSEKEKIFEIDLMALLVKQATNKQTVPVPSVLTRAAAAAASAEFIITNFAKRT